MKIILKQLKNILQGGTLLFCIILTGCYSNKPLGDEIVPIPVNSVEETQKKIEFLGEVIEENPESSDYYFRRADLYLKINKERLAKTDIEKAIKLDSTQGKYYYIHAQILDMMQESKDALKAAQKAEKQEATETELDMLLGKLYFENDVPDKSVKHLKKIEKIFPQRSEIHYYKGKSYRQLKDTANAVASFITAIALRPDYSEAYESLGQLFNEYRKPRAALYYINKGIKNATVKAPLYFMAGHTNRKLLRYDEALDCFVNAVKSDSTYWQASHYLANYFLRKEQISKGMQYLELALSVNPDLNNGYLRLGWLYERYEKKYPTALAHYKKALSQDQDNEGIKKAITRVEKKIADEEYRKSPEYQEKLQQLLEKRKREQELLENIPAEEVVPE